MVNVFYLFDVILVLDVIEHFLFLVLDVIEPLLVGSRGHQT